MAEPEPCDGPLSKSMLSKLVSQLLVPQSITPAGYSPFRTRFWAEASLKVTVKLEAVGGVADGTGVGVLVDAAAGVLVGVGVGGQLSMIRLSKLVFQPLVLTKVTLLQTPIQPIGMLCVWPGCSVTCVAF